MNWGFLKNVESATSFFPLPSSLQVNLRATDVRLMRQLLVINESIEAIKWMIEEKATITSRGSSLSGSLCSLLESQSTSLRGSCSSLQDGGSDGLDGISVGSYLDTLADDVPGHQTPSDLDQLSDSSVTEDSQAPRKHPKLDPQYYCFG
ncbi:leucine rich adaptor protein 1-like [Fukomys damarensis]|uniref:leucine rich adaptor protein 1-like n=1 Tax=Fukomys damarensis TaxID=885580 RepID=UPI00054013E6|nr:leucine rich adaptor protein 1-like [Fukomys damarensis]